MRLHFLSRITLALAVVALFIGSNLRALGQTSAADQHQLDRQLVAAGRNSDLAAVKDLLAAGAHVNAIDDGYTALDGAAAYGNFTLCSYLLHNGANPNLTGDGRPTPLILAVESSNADVIRLLAKSGAKIDGASTDGETPLLRAVFNANNAVALELLNLGASPGLANSAGETPVYMAAYVGDAAILKFLLGHGASTGAVTSDGYTPLGVAAERGHAAAVRVLLAAGAAVNQAPPQGDSALAAGVRSGDPVTFYALLQAGASVNTADQYGDTPLIVAANLATSPKRLAILQTLLDHGASVSAANANGQTALMAAAAAESPNAVNLLVARGAKTDVVDLFGQTAIDYAAAGRRAAVYLWRRPLYSDPEPQGKMAAAAQEQTCAALCAASHSDTPFGRALLVAASNGSLGAITFLVAMGTSPDVVSGDDWYPLLSPLSRAQDPVDDAIGGMTPIMFAAAHNHADAIRMLLAAKATLNATDNAGRTALIHAASCGCPDAVSVLVAAGANVNANDHDGRTALIDVVQYGAVAACAKRSQGSLGAADLAAAETVDAGIVKTLLAANADSHASALNGDTPIKLANDLGRTEIAAALESAGN